MLKTSNNHGFTLVELMITIALLAIVVAIAVPNFTQLIRQNQTQAQANEIAQLIQYARNQAVTRNQPQNITISGTNWQTSGADNTQRNLQVKPEIGFNALANGSSINTLTFNSIGSLSVPSTEVVISVCHSANTNTGYRITISRSGISTVTRLGTCSLK